MLLLSQVYQQLMPNRLKRVFQKDTTLLCLFFICIFFSRIVQSQPINLSLSFLTEYFYFQEFSQQGSILNTESGYISGLEISTDLVLNTHDKLTVFHSFLKGVVDYEGLTQSYEPHNTHTHQNVNFSSISYIKNGNEHGWNFGVDIGIFRWKRDIRPNNDVLGLTEIYTWKNIGFIQEVSTSNIIAGISFYYLFDGSLEVDLNQINRGKVDVPLPEGYQGNLNVDYTVYSKNDLKVLLGLSVKWRYFPRSKPVSFSGGELLEPENELYQGGFGLNFIYSFD